MSTRADASPVAPTADLTAAGPLDGLRIVEIASYWTAYAGRLLAELGAHVILVEPANGSDMRAYEPFLDDVPGPDRSLFWWYYQSSKRGVCIDQESAEGRRQLSELLQTADVVLESAPPLEHELLGLSHELLLAQRADQLVLSITPFGRGTTRANEPATDLTVLAGAGPVWNCGYDDHAKPPVRGGGNQAMHTVGLHAVPALLVAVLHRYASGVGQWINVSAHAACNVTTEAGSYEWLVAQNTVQRQTGRHAAATTTEPVVTRDRNGRPVYTGVPPRAKADLQAVIDWIDELGLRDEFPEIVLLEMGVERGGLTWQDIFADEFCMQIFAAGRPALMLIASRITDYEFFLGGQRRGFAVGVINAPEDVMTDPHFADRGFHVPVHHEDIDRTIVYSGAPMSFSVSPWKIRSRAPRLGEHNRYELVVYE